MQNPGRFTLHSGLLGIPGGVPSRKATGHNREPRSFASPYVEPTRLRFVP